MKTFKSFGAPSANVTMPRPTVATLLNTYEAGADTLESLAGLTASLLEIASGQLPPGEAAAAGDLLTRARAHVAAMRNLVGVSRRTIRGL